MNNFLPNGEGEAIVTVDWVEDAEVSRSLELTVSDTLGSIKHESSIESKWSFGGLWLPCIQAVIGNLCDILCNIWPVVACRAGVVHRSFLSVICAHMYFFGEAMGRVL